MTIFEEEKNWNLLHKKIIDELYIKFKHLKITQIYVLPMFKKFKQYKNLCRKKQNKNKTIVIFNYISI